MADLQITHSRKDGSDTDRRLDGFRINGNYYDIDAVIESIRKRVHTFYVAVRGYRVDVLAKQHANGRWYVTTQGDGFPPNNLLALPDC